MLITGCAWLPYYVQVCVISRFWKIGTRLPCPVICGLLHALKADTLWIKGIRVYIIKSQSPVPGHVCWKTTEAHQCRDSTEITHKPKAIKCNERENRWEHTRITWFGKIMPTPRERTDSSLWENNLYKKTLGLSHITQPLVHPLSPNPKNKLQRIIPTLYFSHTSTQDLNTSIYFPCTHNDHGQINP